MWIEHEDESIVYQVAEEEVVHHVAPTEDEAEGVEAPRPVRGGRGGGRAKLIMAGVVAALVMVLGSAPISVPITLLIVGIVLIAASRRGGSAH